jgi:putative transferase (TIGR04331 family)
MSNKTCLVVSNYKSCWDINSKLAFISKSVPDYLDTEWLKTINYSVLEGPWGSRDYRTKHQKFVVDRVVRYRKELSSVLNSALDIDSDERVWGILLDSWLLHFISIIYDRVNKLENAQKQLEGIFLKCPEGSARPAATTSDFLNSCVQDSVNQQLYCDVAQALGIEVEHCIGLLAEEPHSTEKESVKNMICSLMSPLVRWWVRFRKPLVIVDVYVPIKKMFWINLCSLGKILLIPSKIFLKKIPAVEKNESLRNLIKVSVNDKYDLVANRLFAQYLPLSLLEGVNHYSEKISGLKGIPILGSAVGFYYNEEFKILAGRVLEDENKIIGFQHGGNYNIEKKGFFCGEYFENLNADKFYRWKEKSISKKYLPSHKLVMILAYKKARKKKTNFVDILMVSTIVPPVVLKQEAENADNFLRKITAQQNFYLGLNGNICKYFLLRPHPVDFGWRYKERWIDLTGERVRFDPNAQLGQSLVSCRVYVSDHLSTSWLEAFFCEVPVILFFDLDLYFFVDEVEELFEELQAVGVFHSTAESAAAFLNEKYEAIEEWWEMPETKAAVDKVKDYFFTDTSNNFTKEWTQELVALRDKALKDKLNHKKSSVGLT